MTTARATGSDAIASDITLLQQLAADFVLATEAFKQKHGATQLEQLRDMRMRIAKALLDLTEPVGQGSLAKALNTIATCCLNSGIRAFPRTPAEEDLFERCRKAAIPWQADTVGASGLAALLLSWHAFELGVVPPLALIPPALRSSWLSYLFETPPAFARVGDGDRIVGYLQQLCDRLNEQLASRTAPVRDLASAFFSSTIFMQSYFNELNLRDLMRARGKIIEQMSETLGGTIDQLRILRPVRQRPRIGFISLGISDGTEGVYQAAYMERLDRRRYEVRLYSIREPAGKIGALCRASAETYLRLPDAVADAVRLLRREELDIAIFVTNLTAVVHAVTLIAAHRIAPIQVAMANSVGTTGLRNIDVLISGERNETADSPAHYTERLALIPGALNCYPFHHMLEGQVAAGVVSRTTLGIPDNAVLYFSAANYYKIVPELSFAWMQILAQVPDSQLFLMPFNPNWSSSYALISFRQRLLQQAAEAGVDPERIRTHPTVPTISQLHQIMAVADVYLDAFPFSGACSLYDALEVGLPVVAHKGQVCRSRHSAAMLEQAGLGEWAVPDVESYVRNAVELGRHPEKRVAERNKLENARKNGLNISDTADFARRLMPVLDGILADWDKRAEACQAIDPAESARRIFELAVMVDEGRSPFTDLDLVTRVVLSYLRGSHSRRMIDVGACMGAVTMLFLAEGWQSIMFEPDERCRPQLASLLDAFPGQVRHESKAVTADLDGSVTFHVAALPGLSGMSNSPFADDLKTMEVPAVSLAKYIARNGLFDVDFIKIDAEGYDFDILNGIAFDKVAPRLIMVEFGDQFPGQDRAAVDAQLRRMQQRGYRAAVFCARALGQFERQEWGTGLLAVGIDAVPATPQGLPIFGNILFFPDHDREFAPSLCDWLERVSRSI
ncbi:MAG: FkbM family methyltransferase [Xanthobacteraceae bacterium]